MAYQFSSDDLTFLLSAAGSEALIAGEQYALGERTLIADLNRLRKAYGERAAAVAEQVRLRRAATTKLGDRARNWLFTADAVQQASPWAVSQHRARRMRAADGGVHDLTCSTGTDTIALAAAGCRVLGSDLDPVRLAFARHNAPELAFVCADALTRVSRGLLPYADPARRSATGRRITSAATIPPLADLDAVWADRPPVLRVPPGIDYEDLRRPGEVEIVSLDGGVREAVLWPEELARPLIRRRSSVLRTTSAAGEPGVESWEVTDADPDGGSATLPSSGPRPDVDEWIIEPDPAVIRAHLVRHYAARHGLRLLDEHLAYLTGPVKPVGVRGFRVQDSAPFTDRQVGVWVSRDEIGTLEILQRGTAVIPDALRARLRRFLSADTRAAATVVIARIGAEPWAFWCRAERH